MSLPIGRIQKTKFWRGHLHRYKKFSGSQKAYCEENNINPRIFSLYKTKFKRKNTEAATKAVNFSKIVVVPDTAIAPVNAGLPDPVWLAQFLKEWAQK